jgi:hypothetical protein
MRRIAEAFVDVASEAWWELKRSRLRTYLALLGIVIGAMGLTVLVCTLHLENALREKQDVTHIDIWMPRLADYDRTIFRRTPRLKRYELMPEDGEAIQRQCAHVERVHICGHLYPADFKGKNWYRGALVSTNITRLDLFHYGMRAGGAAPDLVWGRLFTQAEVEAGAPVVVITRAVSIKLWPKPMRTLGNGWLGSRHIHINGVKFEVIGVLRFEQLWERAVIPYTSMQDLFWNARWFLDAIPNQGSRKAAAEEIDQLLLERIGDPGYPYVILPGMSYEELKLYTFFGIVGILTLLSAGAALSNKAYIDALERVQQFAVRRALGATKQRIYAIVLMESALICGFGCLYGGIIGWMIFASFSAWKWIAAEIRTPGVWMSYAIPAVPLAAMFLFVIAIGVAGSLQGAAVAAKTDPAKALCGKEVV